MTDASIFGDVIYSYGDEQAVEDGVLVAVSKIDRVTIAVWAYLEDIVAEVEAEDEAEVPDDEPRRTAQDCIDHFRERAIKAWDNPSVGGGLFQFTAKEGDHTLWLIPNEVGGVTLMFPSDY